MHSGPLCETIAYVTRAPIQDWPELTLNDCQTMQTMASSMCLRGRVAEKLSELLKPFGAATALLQDGALFEQPMLSEVSDRVDSVLP